MAISLAHVLHKKPDPRSEYERFLEQAQGDRKAVLACPFGCGEGDQDDFGHCDHLIGFTNAKLPDGAVKDPPADAKVETLDLKRDRTNRRTMCGTAEPLKAGDRLVRVNGTSRRVYRDKPAITQTKKTDAPVG